MIPTMRLSVKPGPIAIIRTDRAVADEVFTSLTDGGIDLIEVTLGTPNCLETVSRWAGRSDAIVGVGSVRTDEDAQYAIASGAQFLVTPTVQVSVLEIAAASDIPVACGALSPTEIDTAWQHGAATVKVFPVDIMGKLAYIKALKGPMPDVSLTPTGGVSVDDARSYAAAGCSGVGVGSALISHQILQDRNWDALTARAEHYREAWVEGTRLWEAAR